MKVGNLGRGTEGKWTTLSATICWEDRERADERVYFATRAPYGAELTETGNPFLLGCVLPAFKHGERRLRIEAPTCPWLRDNVETVVAYFNRWFYAGQRQIVLEGVGDAAPENRAPRTGCFVSGGVDSAFAVRHDREVLGPEHPGRIRDALVVRGFEIRIEQTTSEAAYDAALRAVEPLAREQGLEVLPIVTNLRQVDPSSRFWSDQFQGAILGAAAHALAPRLSDVVIASSCDIANLAPYGTHPSVDPNLSSHSLRIHHRGERFTRLEKLRRMKGWRTALDNLRVCSKAAGEGLNCGRCEKCVRVMLELLVVDELHRTPAFGADDVTPGMIEAIRVDAESVVFHAELLPALTAIGRRDLARALGRHVLRDLPRRLQGYAEDIVKDLDQAFLQDRIRRRVQRWRGVHEGMA